MIPSAAKVAREWSTSLMQGEIRLFGDYVTAFWQAVKSHDRLVNYRWADMINSGSKLAPWLVETRSVPRGKAKAFEMAVRLFMSARQSPRNLVTWVRRNEKNIAVFEVALGWPEKATADEGGDEVFRLEGFTVHNTMQLEGKQLENTKTAITKAVRAIKGSGIPNAAGSIYGNLFIVGRINQPRVLAWYNVSSDEMYLRPHPRVGSDEIHNLVHELGHRYWHKLMSTDRQRKFARYDSYIKYMKTTPVAMPSVGDVLPVPMRGHRTPPTIISDDGVFLGIEGGGRVKRMQLFKMLRQEAKDANYPTPYAATKYTEHFAEAFAMYALGTLEDHHREAFETVVVNGEDYSPDAVEGTRTPAPSAFEDHPEVKAVEALLETVERKRLPTLKQDSRMVSLGLKKLKAGRLLPGQRAQLLTLFGLYEVDPPDGWGPAPAPPPAPAPEPAPAPPTSTPSSGLPERPPSGSALLTMVRELEGMARRRRTKKVLKFVEGVRETLEDGGRIGPRREKRLTRILQSYGLLADPGAQRVATRWLGVA